MPRQCRAVVIKQVRGQSPPCLRSATKRDRIQMHALEMLRSLVLFGITDRAEGVLRLKRNAPQRVARESNCAIGQVTPIAVAGVMKSGHVIQNEAGALEGTEAVRELVLNRL